MGFICLALLFLVFLLALVLAWEGVQVYVIYQVIVNPQPIALLSYAAAAFAIVMNIFYLGLFALHVVPYKRTEP
jgi:hypothetical protein